MWGDGSARAVGWLSGVVPGVVDVAFFGIVGHVEFVATVMAVAYSFAQVDGERFVSFVSAGVVALGADGFDFAAVAAFGVDSVLVKVSHFQSNCF